MIPLGFKHSEESKKKMSDRKKGIKPKNFLTLHSLENRKKAAQSISKAKKGVEFSEEHKKHLSESHKRNGLKPPSALGRKHTEEWKRKQSEIAKRLGVGKWMKGRKLSEEHKKKLSLRMIGNRLGVGTVGEKNGNWKGGINPINNKIRGSLEYKLWRKAIFERDNYTCIWCGNNTSGNLNADHIKPFSIFSELRFAIDNGRTLCIECHKKTDTYGMKILNYI